MKLSQLYPILLLLLFLIYGCGSNISKSKIGSYLSEKCLSQECDFELSEIVTEPWDTVYFFDQNITLDFIRQTIKTDFEFVDVGRKIIFIKDAEIVYFEDEFPNPEMTKKNELIFNVGNNSVLKVNRSNSRFRAMKEDNHFVIQHKPY